MNQGTLFFAGGGTGGHLYPAIAVAEQTARRSPDTRIHFLCSQRPIDRQILSKTPFAFTPLPAAGWSPSPMGLLRFCKGFHASSTQAKGMLKHAANPVVVGVGGFVCAPAIRAARGLGIPIMLINVDIVAGKANRLCAHWAGDIFLQFDQARETFRAVRANLHVVGCPLRADFSDPRPDRARQDLGLDRDKYTLLVTGASSGARHINEAVCDLPDDLEAFARHWQIVHLTGNDHLEPVRKAYEHRKIHHTVIGYVDRMADLLGCADLVIGRSGAVSVAEYIAAGVPAICMPYPWHKDRHQYRNAGILVEADAAIIVDDVPDRTDRSQWLWEELAPLMRNKDRRDAMKRNMHCLARPDAAQRIAGHILRTLQAR